MTLYIVIESHWGHSPQAQTLRDRALKIAQDTQLKGVTPYSLPVSVRESVAIARLPDGYFTCYSLLLNYIKFYLKSRAT